MSTFTHTPRPPCVSKGQFCYQRRYGTASSHSTEMPERLGSHTTELEVYRRADQDLAEIRIAAYPYCHAAAPANPAELREMAARLLDAAHDIETNPAAKVKKTMAAEECPA